MTETLVKKYTIELADEKTYVLISDLLEQITAPRIATMCCTTHRQQLVNLISSYTCSIFLELFENDFLIFEQFKEAILDPSINSFCIESFGKETSSYVKLLIRYLYTLPHLFTMDLIKYKKAVPGSFYLHSCQIMISWENL